MAISASKSTMQQRAQSRDHRASASLLCLLAASCLLLVEASLPQPLAASTKVMPSRKLQVAQDHNSAIVAAWDQWKVRYGRQYASKAEEAQALQAFQDNMRVVAATLADAAQVTADDMITNKFADLSWQQFQQRYLSNLQNVSLPASWKDAQDASALNVTDDATTRRRLQGYTGPATSNGGQYLSWADVRKYRTPVRDQGSCASCWAFAAIHGLEFAYSIQLDRQGGMPSGYAAAQFSVQQALECFSTNLGACGWGSAAEFYNQLTTKSLVTENYYPLTADKSGQTGSCKTSAVSSGEAANSDINYTPSTVGYVRLQNANKDALMAQLKISPVVCHYEVDVQFMLWTAQKTPVYTAQTCTGTNLNHALVVVGYDLTTSPPSWIMKNSWGPNWGGLKGYVRVAMTDAGTCGMYQWCFRPDSTFGGGSSVKYTDDGSDNGLYDEPGSSPSSSDTNPSPRPPAPPLHTHSRRMRI